MVSRLFPRRRATWLFPAAVVLIACVAAWPALAEPGLLNTRGGGDSPFLLQRLHQLTTALAGGHFPARWMPDAAYGEGYPFYNFYAPLSIYVAAAFRLLGFSFVRAIHLAQLAGFVVAGLGVFYLARRWLGSPWAGLLAAAAYTAAPFHMVNVYVRGDSLAEFWAMALYPLVLLAADRLVTTNDELRTTNSEGRPATDEGRATNDQRPTTLRAFARPVALFALAYAALILSHNISALIFSPFLLLYMGMKWWEGSKRDTSLLLPLAALVLAFALAAFFFVPALAEQNLAQLGPVTEGYFHFSNHFRGLDLVQRRLLFDYDPDGRQAFSMGLAQVGLALAGAAVLVWRNVARFSRTAPAGGKWQLGFVVIGFLVATVMITPLSRSLWEYLPLLPFTQFPWRFLSVQALFAALLTGGLALLPGRAGPIAAVVGSAALLAAALLGLRTDHLLLTDADVTAERLAQYEWFTGNIGTTISAEYLTPDAVPRPWTSAWLNSGERDRATAAGGELRAATLEERPAAAQSWTLEAGPGGATVVLPTLYWPGWRATLDGQPAALAAHPGSGLMTLAVPEGQHVLRLELGRTPVRAAAEWLSLAALAATVALLAVGGRVRRWRAVAGGAGVTVALLLLLAVLWRNDPTELPPDDLTWDFAQMAYLHHDRDGVAFDNGARLDGYDTSADEITAGETLTITLRIEPGDGGLATLALVTPASARPKPDGAADPPVLVAATQPLADAPLVFALPIPAGAPPGLYVPRLTLDGARPLLPSGGTRGELFLRPVRVGTTDDGRQTTGDATTNNQRLTTPNNLDVRATQLTMRDATTLDGHFAWYTARPLGARYAFSWRLQDAAGATLAQLDAQPGYGYLPSTLWPPGAWTADWLALRLPAAAPAVSDYPLVMRLYDAGSGRELLARRVGVVAWDGRIWQPRLHEPTFALPDGLTPLEVTFSDGHPLIALRGYELAQETDALRLTLYWQALADTPGDFARFVHLLDASEANVAQSDGAPAGDSYPTGQWQSGEIVADTVTFDLSALPPGEYRLATGFYRPTGDMPRLAATGPDGPLSDGRALLPEVIEVR